MSVSAYNYRFRNTYYHTQGYFGIVDSNTEIPTIEYAGYKNAISPQMLIKVSEWSNLTERAPIEYFSYIEGDINGFTNASTVNHTECHIFATNGSDYAIGIATILYDKTDTQYVYATIIYFWSTETNGKWFNIGGYFNSVRNVVVGIPEDINITYNTLPSYLYLMAIENSTPGSVYYPYPNRLGMGYYDQDSVFHFLSNSKSSTDYLIPVLVELMYTVDTNPDPDPTPLVNDDPYAPAGGSWTGGGSGTWEQDSDDIDIPGLPSLSAASTGFITLFNPTAAQMRNLASYMWSGLFDIESFRKIFADPMDCILGLSIVPVNVPSGGSANVTVGNIDTGISLTTASAQYVEVACGSVTVNEYSGTCMDYDGSGISAELYLPYIGTHALRVDDIMGKTITVTYHVDILSGACVAYVKCGSSVLYSFAGQCASSIPISGNDWTNVVNGALSIAASIGSMVATGGATAPMAATNIASTALNTMKPSVEKSGSISGTAGMMGVQKPYLIITRPRIAAPEKQSHFTGYPSFITSFIGELSGYTEVENIHLEGVPCTEAELAEIESLLKGGVIV